MAKKKNAIKYFLDHPQIKRKKALGNGEGPKQSSGGFMAGVKNLFSGGSKPSTETKSTSSKTSFASNSGGAAKASSGFGALISGNKPKK